MYMYTFKYFSLRFNLCQRNGRSSDFLWKHGHTSSGEKVHVVINLDALWFKTIIDNETFVMLIECVYW